MMAKPDTPRAIDTASDEKTGGDTPGASQWTSAAEATKVIAIRGGRYSTSLEVMGSHPSAMSRSSSEAHDGKEYQ
jgi:hypothetical protein